MILKHAGANVTTATTGGEAVEAYSKSAPQIVLSDIGLPDFDGYALLGKIRAIEGERKWAEAPAVALTAFAREGDRKKAFDAGFRVHLAKPIDADRLIEALAGVAQRQ
jgi:CheY-like chemotaxis protein